MSSNNNDDSDITASAIDVDSFDSMNEPLILAQIINLLTRSIPSTPNSALSTSAESATKERSATIDYFPSLIDAPMKDGATNFHSAAQLHAKESNSTVLEQPKKTMLLHTVLS